MAKRMLIDATQPEETRVAVVSGNRLEEYDFETASKKQLKGNIYLAKVVRVEPSLQAAFVDYGGNRHGFLAFSEIHPDYYKIPVEDRAALIAEEREMAHAEDRMEAMGLEQESTAAIRRPATLPDSGGSAVSRILPGEGSDSGAEDAGLSSVETLEPPAEEGEAEPHEAEHEFFDAEGVEGDTGHGAEPEMEPYSTANQDLGIHDMGMPDMGAEMEAGDGMEGSAETLSGGGAEEGFMPQAPQRAPAAESVETVGGDEVEVEVPRRRHPSRRYKIQEVIKRRQVMLVQVTKEERGTKGAALTTRLSLAGRYCVLMPNTGRGGGISRKITTMQDRKRLREIVDGIEIPEGISVIVRTAGAKRTKPEIKRDFDYLLRLWSDIRELTLQSTAPALIYEEANLIKRSIRDLYARDMDDILVEGEEAYKLAKEFMRTLMPSHAKRVQPYRSPNVPLFQKFQIESQIAAIHSPLTRLKSGGYIVINQTEALVAIDVNSGRSTRERNIEETATQTNLEAADEVARQLRLRDLAGLIVIDFIDMEHERNRRNVEKRLKDALKNDRARIQLGRISPFGLLEMSRQRLRPSLHEISTERCPHCQGSGVVRSTESTALQVLRAIEEEGLKKRSAEIAVFAPPKVALYILNQKRPMLTGIETRHLFHVLVNQDEALVPPDFRIEVVRTRTPAEIAAAEAAAREAPEPEIALEPEPEIEEIEEIEEEAEEAVAAIEPAREERPHRRPEPQPAPKAESMAAEAEGMGGEHPRKRRRRGKRGGRRRRGRGGAGPAAGGAPQTDGGPLPVPADDQAAFEADDEPLPAHPGDQRAFEAAVHAAESAREGGGKVHERAPRAHEGERHEGGGHGRGSHEGAGHGGGGQERGEGRRRRRRRGRGGGNGPGRPPSEARPMPAETGPRAGQTGHAPESHRRDEPAPAAERAAPRQPEAAAADSSEGEAKGAKRRGWWQRLIE